MKDEVLQRSRRIAVANEVSRIARSKVKTISLDLGSNFAWADARPAGAVRPASILVTSSFILHLSSFP
jgi:hypothetical protein